MAVLPLMRLLSSSLLTVTLDLTYASESVPLMLAFTTGLGFDVVPLVRTRSVLESPALASVMLGVLTRLDSSVCMFESADVRLAPVELNEYANSWLNSSETYVMLLTDPFESRTKEKCPRFVV